MAAEHIATSGKQSVSCEMASELMSLGQVHENHSSEHQRAVVDCVDWFRSDDDLKDLTTLQIWRIGLYLAADRLGRQRAPATDQR